MSAGRWEGLEFLFDLTPGRQYGVMADLEELKSLVACEATSKPLGPDVRATDMSKETARPAVRPR